MACRPVQKLVTALYVHRGYGVEGEKRPTFLASCGIVRYTSNSFSCPSSVGTLKSVMRRICLVIEDIFTDCIRCLYFGIWRDDVDDGSVLRILGLSV